MIHVMEIRFPDTTAEVAFSSEQQMSRLLTLLHRSAKGKRFAVGLPEYQDGACRALGKCLQVFSFDGIQVLRDIMIDRRLAMFIMDWCQASPVHAVHDADITNWVIFRKSQLAKKSSASYQRRAARRTAEGRRTTNLVTAEESRADSLMKRLPRFFHYSQRSDMEVPLFIERSEGQPGSTPLFDSFGLSLSGSCGVPVLVLDKK